MLFADLRGFTALCDQHDPDVTVRILNDYFRHMSQAIDRHHGHVTEFVGDGLLALFGATEANPWQERDAVLAAQAMRAELALCNVTLRARGLPELRFGIGIHCGEVVAGVIGTAGLSNQRHGRSDQRRLEGRRLDQQVPGRSADYGGHSSRARRRLPPAGHAASLGQGQGGADPDLLCGARCGPIAVDAGLRSTPYALRPLDISETSGRGDAFSSMSEAPTRCTPAPR